MLEVRALSVAYGKHRALEGVSLAVKRGEIVVILGANGAGKSSLLKAISGISEGRVEGSVTMEGAELVGMPPHAIVEHGIALVPEGRGIFADLTVAENLTLGAYSRRAREDEAGNLDRVLALFPKLAERRKQQVRTMSGGEQQMVAIGRAMMSNPALLTLDEPSLGLSPLLSRELFQNLKRVRDAGIGILLVEQNARQSLAIADRGYLLENARIVHAAPAEALRSDPAVQAAYLGGGGTATGIAARKPAAAPSEPRPAMPKPTPPRPAAQSPADIAAAALSGFQANRRDRPAQPPSPAPSAPQGIPVQDLVRHAAEASRAQVGGPVPTPRPAEKVTKPAVSMPDLGESRDRLKSVLSEIEEAALRASAWRPDPRRK